MIFLPHHDQRTDQWVLIHADGPKRGLRVCLMDEEWFNRPVGLDPVSCGLIIDEKSPDGSDNYDVRFAHEAGVQLWLDSLKLWCDIEKVAKRMFSQEVAKLRRNKRYAPVNTVA